MCGRVTPFLNGVDLHTLWKYVQEFARVLRLGGHALIHTSNLLTQQGWDRFSQQKEYSVGGFYFTSPDVVRNLIKRTGVLEIVKESSESDEESMYYKRDYLVVVKKV